MCAWADTLVRALLALVVVVTPAALASPTAAFKSISAIEAGDALGPTRVVGNTTTTLAARTRINPVRGYDAPRKLSEPRTSASPPRRAAKKAQRSIARSDRMSSRIYGI